MFIRRSYTENRKLYKKTGGVQMKIGKHLWAIGLTVLTSTVLMSSTLAATSQIKLEYCNTREDITTNTIGNKIKLTNMGKETVSLEDLKVRYYYTVDEKLPQSFWCDHAGMMHGYQYKTLTSSVTSSFKTMETATQEADSYVEIGFKQGAGEIEAGESIELQIRIANSKWKNYDQSNDYSYQESTHTYLSNEQITLYYKDSCISGIEPGGQQGIKDGQVTPNRLTYDKNKEVKESVKFNIIFNEHTLKELTNNGEVMTPYAYTISQEGECVLKEEYLENLPVGDHNIKIHFNQGKSAEVLLKVVDTTDYDFAMIINKINLKAGEEMIVPVKLNNVKTGINNASFVFKYNPGTIEVQQVTAGTIVPAADESLITAIDEHNGKVHLLFAGAKQDGSDLIIQSGELIGIKIKAKQDVQGLPFSVESMADIADKELRPIEVLFKEK